MLASESDLSGPGKLRSRSGEVAYDTLPNPYILEVMQQAMDSFVGGVTLNASHLYVRFKPVNRAQMDALKDSLGLELFHYPPTLNLGEGEEYIDPSVPEGEFYWQYAVVEPDFAFPDSIVYEVLEQCFIPAEDNLPAGSRTGNAALAIELEDLADRLVGLDEFDEGGVSGAMSRGHQNPEGWINYWDTKRGCLVPACGVKVKCHRIIKSTSTFTNSEGYYYMGGSFRYNCHYAVIFENARKFSIHSSWYAPLSSAHYSIGWYRPGVKIVEIYADAGAWPWFVVNGAGWDYYAMCDQTGIALPPNNLKIWVNRNWEKSSASMFRRVWHAVSLIDGGHTIMGRFFSWIVGTSIPTLLNNLLKPLEPDLTIGARSNQSESLYNTVNHEMAHASHFSSVGSAHWAQYISYIAMNGMYGSPSFYKAELCAVGEMWGYVMGEIQEYEKYSGIIPVNEPYTGNENEWFKPHVFWDLYANRVLTKKQIYDCLRPGVTDYNSLVSKMYEKYPLQADSIEAVFARYLIQHGAQKPIPPPPVDPPQPYILSIWADGDELPLPIGAGSVIKFGARVEDGGGTEYSWSAWQVLDIFPVDPEIIPLSNGIPFPPITPPTSESTQWVKFNAPGNYIVQCTAKKNGTRVSHQMNMWVEGSVPYIMPGTPVNLITVPGRTTFIPGDTIPWPFNPITLP